MQVLNAAQVQSVTGFDLQIEAAVEVAALAWVGVGQPQRAELNYAFKLGGHVGAGKAEASYSAGDGDNIRAYGYLGLSKLLGQERSKFSHA